VAEGKAAGARAALFDLAIARADAYVRRARVPLARDAADIARALEVWHLKTRFAARVPLAHIAAVLAQRPAGEAWVWRGGHAGAWTRGDPHTPAADGSDGG